MCLMLHFNFVLFLLFFVFFAHDSVPVGSKQQTCASTRIKERVPCHQHVTKQVCEVYQPGHRGEVHGFGHQKSCCTTPLVHP